MPLESLSSDFPNHVIGRLQAKYGKCRLKDTRVG
jgi:hypothetical protein